MFQVNPANSPCGELTLFKRREVGGRNWTHLHAVDNQSLFCVKVRPVWLTTFRLRLGEGRLNAHRQQHRAYILQN
jgi:hypothetical protein